MGKGGANKLRKCQGGLNVKSVLRHEHLKNLALWSPIPSLATFFGRCLAASDIPHDLFSCQRCETILQNCKVRIEKKHMRYKNIFLPQNNVVYYCNLCSHRNLKRGTAKGQMKEMYPARPRPKMEKETMTLEIQSNMLSSSSSSSPERSGNDQVEKNTPKPMLTLERDRRIRKSKSKKPISVPEKTSVRASNKRKRKAWTTTNKSCTNTNSSITFPCQYETHFCFEKMIVVDRESIFD